MQKVWNGCLVPEQNREIDRNRQVPTPRFEAGWVNVSGQ